MPDEVRASHIELFSRNGFAGPNTTIVRARYRPRFVRTPGEYVPRRFHTRDLPAEAFAGPKTLPVPILTGEDIGFELNRRAGATDFGYVDVWADELHYIIAGRGELDTEVGALEVRAGDFVLIPRAVTYRWGEIAEEIREFIVVIESELRLGPECAPGTFNPDLHPDKGTLFDGHLTVRPSNGLLDIVDTVVSCLRLPIPSYQDSFCKQIGRRPRQAGSSADQRPATPHSPGARSVEKVGRYMGRHYALGHG